MRSDQKATVATGLADMRAAGTSELRPSSCIDAQTATVRDITSRLSVLVARVENINDALFGSNPSPGVDETGDVRAGSSLGRLSDALLALHAVVDDLEAEVDRQQPLY